MSNINRSFSFLNNSLIEYLSEGKFARDFESIAYYGNTQNTDIDALFALIRRLEFMLADYEPILAGGVMDYSLIDLDVNQIVNSVANELAPNIASVLRGDKRRLSSTDSEYVHLMLKILLAKSSELRMLVICWLTNRMSAEGVVDEYILLMPTKRAIT